MLNLSNIDAIARGVNHQTVTSIRAHSPVACFYVQAIDYATLLGPRIETKAQSSIQKTTYQ